MFPITIKLAGTSQPEVQQNIRKFGNAQNGPFQLERDLENPFDTNAIRVTSHGQLLGYVPRKEASDLAVLMDIGLDVTAELVRVNSSPYYEIIGLTVRIVPIGTDSQSYIDFADRYLKVANR